MAFKKKSSGRKDEKTIAGNKKFLRTLGKGQDPKSPNSNVKAKTKPVSGEDKHRAFSQSDNKPKPAAKPAAKPKPSQDVKAEPKKADSNKNWTPTSKKEESINDKTKKPTQEVKAKPKPKPAGKPKTNTGPNTNWTPTCKGCGDSMYAHGNSPGYNKSLCNDCYKGNK